MLVTLKKLFESSIYTVQFVKHFDCLFNTFNSRSLQMPQKLAHPYITSSGHHVFLQSSMGFLDKLKKLMTSNFPVHLDGMCL